MSNWLNFEKSIMCPSCQSIVYVNGEVKSDYYVDGIDIIVKEHICKTCNKIIYFKPYVEFLPHCK
jgi:endogenous inhibitor of DNA gyrase (YacG/DUF329 family)